MYHKLMRLIPISGFFFLTLLLVFMSLSPVVAYQPLNVQYTVFLLMLIVIIASSVVGMVVSIVLSREYKTVPLVSKKKKK